MYKRILVAFDGSEESNKALVAALQLAREGDARLRIMHMVEGLTSMAMDPYGAAWSTEIIDSLRKSGEQTLAKALEIARAAGVEADTELFDIVGSRLAESVVDAVKNFDADLVVVGTHGRHGMGRLLMGSGAEQIVRLAPVPVLVIRGASRGTQASTEHS